MKQGRYVYDKTEIHTDYQAIECWYKDDQLHNEYGPAQIKHLESGEVKSKLWCQNDQVHRIDGPAVIIYQDKKVWIKSWWQNSLKHREDGPAHIAYDRDGECVKQIYCLNHVEVPDWFVMTPAEKLNPKNIFELSVDQRREFVKKVGLERIISEIGKVIESDKNYQLVNMLLDDENYRPYLKMINPSTGDYHIEGVHPSCSTVQQALEWRNGRNDRPTRLT